MCSAVAPARCPSTDLGYPICEWNPTSEWPSASADDPSLTCWRTIVISLPPDLEGSLTLVA